MANFKVGDTVEIVEENDNSSVNKKGDIGIVLEINEYPNGISTLYRVEVENRGRSCNWETEEDLKLVKVMEKFKVGDKVEVTDGTANSNEVGDIGIITEMDIDNTYRVTVKGNSNSGNWMYPSMFKLVESPVNTTKYVEVSGKDLVIGRTYYTRSNGSDKAIYEGLIENGRCLFTPIGSTTYEVYSSSDYNGMYTGKFSIYLNGFFYEDRESNKESKQLKPVSGDNLVIGNIYYTDFTSNTLGTYVGVDIDSNKILFDVKDNKGGYRRNSDGYVDFVFMEGNYFYEVK